MSRVSSLAKPIETTMSVPMRCRNQMLRRRIRRDRSSVVLQVDRGCREVQREQCGENLIGKFGISLQNSSLVCRYLSLALIVVHI